MARRPAPKAPPQKSFPLFPVIAAVVVVLGVVAIVVSRGSGSGKKSTVKGVEETRTVTITGAPLPDYATGRTPDAAAGMVIPTVKGQSFDGSPVEIGNDGKPKLVMFVAHWCPHCQKEVPLISQYLASHQPPSGVELLGVSTSVNADAPNYPPSAWLTREHWPVRTIADDSNGTAANAFGLTSFPYFVATDASGKVVARSSGEISMDDFAALMQKAAVGA